ncbi:MAG: hypothetical protein HY010_19955 [Acidobacteria bacterium]|nr:hypothetical protein [Acidobacteriota bacterium]
MRRNLAVLGVVGIAAVAAAVLGRDVRPVLIRMPFGVNQETGDHNYVLFNPFRDRSPEHAAAAYLDAMRSGNCTDAAKLSTDLVLPNALTCEEMQSEYRDHRSLFVQRLRDRRKEGSDVVLYYSDTGVGVEGNWVAVRQLGGDRAGWRVVGFNKIW